MLQLPDGKPYIVGSPTFPLVAKCARCKRITKVTALQFARLPDLSLEQLEANKALEPLTRDWVGSGLPREHAHDLIAMGLMGPGSFEHRPETNTEADQPEEGTTMPGLKNVRFNDGIGESK